MPHTPTHVDTSTFTAEQQRLFDEAAALAPAGSVTSTGTSITGTDLTPVAPPTLSPTEPLAQPTVQPVSDLGAPTVGDFDTSIGELETAVSDVSFLDREATAASQLATQTEAQQRRIIEIGERFSQLEVEKAGALGVAEERGVLQPFAVGEAGRAQRAITLQQMSLNIEKAAVQNQIQLARQTIDRKVELEFSERQQELNRARANLIVNFSSFTGKDKKRAESLLIQLDGDLSALNAQKQSRKEIEGLVAQGISQGLSQQGQDAALAADNILDAQRIITDELGIPTEPEAARRTQVVEVAGRKLLIDTQTGETISDLGVARIPGEPTVKEPTGTQRVAAGFALRAEDANRIVTELGAEFTGIGKRLPLLEGLKSEDRKSIEQAERNFVNAILRRESGAAIAPSEFTSAEKQYFPARGDTAAILQQKQRNRQVVIEALRLEAGDAFTQLKVSLPPLQQKVTIGGVSYEVGEIIQNASGQRARVNADGTFTFI